MNSNHAQIWDVLRDKLPYQTTPAETEKRSKYWSAIDVNNNGYVSLAEIDKGMRDVIQVPILFNLKPVLMRAFQAAKQKLPAKNKHGDDYVSRAEFRYLLMYLRQYYEYWVAFDDIDKNDDRRISFEQFSKSIPTLERWGIKGNAKELFKQADSDGKGMILFDQFCRWAIKKNLDVDNDDDAL